MARPPKPADYKALRRLHTAAGSRAELNRWTTAALKEGKQTIGRPNYAETFTLGTLIRLCEADGRTRTALIRQLVRDNPRLRGTGTEQSAIIRIKRKLHMLAKHHEQHPAAWEAFFADLADLIRATK